MVDSASGLACFHVVDRLIAPTWVASGPWIGRGVADPVPDRVDPVLGGEHGRRPVRGEGQADAVRPHRRLVPQPSGREADAVGTAAEPQRRRLPEDAPVGVGHEGDQVAGGRELVELAGEARHGTPDRRLVPAAPGHRRLLDRRGVHIALDDRCAAPPGRGHDRIDGAADVPGIRRTCLLDRFPSLEEIVLHRHPRLYAPARGVTGSVRRFDSARVFADRSSQPTFVQPRWGDALGWRRASACRPPPGAHGSAGSGAGPPARLPLPALQDRPPGGSGRRDRTPVRPTSPRQASPAPDALRSARDPEPG